MGDDITIIIEMNTGTISTMVDLKGRRRRNGIVLTKETTAKNPVKRNTTGAGVPSTIVWLKAGSIVHDTNSSCMSAGNGTVIAKRSNHNQLRQSGTSLESLV